MKTVDSSLKKMSSGVSKRIKMALAFEVMILFGLLYPTAHITSMGMKVVGVFFCTVLLISLNEAIVSSFGSGITIVCFDEFYSDLLVPAGR